AHRAALRQYLLEDGSAAGIEWFALAPEIAGEPRNFRLPGLHHAGGRVGMGRHLLVIDILRNPLERRAGAQFGTRHHRAYMLDGDDLSFRYAMHVHVAREEIFDATIAQRLLEIPHIGRRLVHFAPDLPQL